MRQEQIADASLRRAIQRAELGLIDADLGGGLISSGSLVRAEDDPADTA